MSDLVFVTPHAVTRARDVLGWRGPDGEIVSRICEALSQQITVNPAQGGAVTVRCGEGRDKIRAVVALSEDGRGLTVVTVMRGNKSKNKGDVEGQRIRRALRQAPSYIWKDPSE